MAGPGVPEGRSYGESGEDRGDVAAFRPGPAHLFGDKFGSEFSTLEFSGVVIGIRTRNFAVDKNDQLDFESDFDQIGLSARPATEAPMTPPTLERT